MFIVYNRVDDLAEPTRDATYLLKNGLEWAHASRTVLLVTHRVSTIRDAYRILVLNQGRIEDVDSHDEIAERNGLYKRLCAMQLVATGDERKQDSEGLDECHES